MEQLLTEVFTVSIESLEYVIKEIKKVSKKCEKYLKKAPTYTLSEPYYKEYRVYDNESMNYKKLETLVLMAKEDNKEAKEEIIAFFRPLILKTCKNTFIPGYDFNDLESECCTILLKAIKLYNPSKQAFAGYA